jgi:hypothetical protein
MIPPFTISGVLPPFLGSSIDPANVSPYLVTMTELVGRFGISAARISILRGLVDYRSALAAAGISDGFQIIDGSFSENIEQIELRAPQDIDIVTFARRPIQAKSAQDWDSFTMSNQSLFVSQSVKAQHHCDAYYVDLDQTPEFLVDSTGYWYGVFAHRRNGLWKGMLRLPLQSDDVPASQMLMGP